LGAASQKKKQGNVLICGLTANHIRSHQRKHMVKVGNERGRIDWRLAFIEHNQHNVIPKKSFPLPLLRRQTRERPEARDPLVSENEMKGGKATTCWPNWSIFELSGSSVDTWNMIS